MQRYSFGMHGIMLQTHGLPNTALLLFYLKVIQEKTLKQTMENI